VAHHGSTVARLLTRGWRLLGGPPGAPGTPASSAGLAACCRLPVAILVGLVALAADVCPPAHASPQHPGQLAYSALDDRSADVAAFELDKGAAPGPSGAPFFHLPCRLRAQVASGSAPSRAPLPTRDRSPPLR